MSGTRSTRSANEIVKSCSSGMRGQSYTEIARQARLSVGAVGTTLARARRRLAEAYSQKEHVDVAR